VLHGRPRLACLGIGLHDQVPRRAVAEVFRLPLSIRQPEDAFLLVAPESERLGLGVDIVRVGLTRIPPSI